MKPGTFRIDWLIPVLGLGVVGGGYLMTRSYVAFEAEIRSGEQTQATFASLMDACHLNRVQMQAQNTGCAMTALSLDQLVSAKLATVNAQLASSDPHTRFVAETVFDYIARQRSENPPAPAESSAGRGDRDAAAQKILTQTLASASPGN